MAEVGQDVGADVVFAQQFTRLIGRRRAFTWKCGQTFLTRRHALAHSGRGHRGDVQIPIDLMRPDRKVFLRWTHKEYHAAGKDDSHEETLGSLRR
jgi:hypothetical protein